MLAVASGRPLTTGMQMKHYCSTGTGTMNQMQLSLSAHLHRGQAVEADRHAIGAKHYL